MTRCGVEGPARVVLPSRGGSYRPVLLRGHGGFDPPFHTGRRDYPHHQIYQRPCLTRPSLRVDPSPLGATLCLVVPVRRVTRPTRGPTSATAGPVGLTVSVRTVATVLPTTKDPSSFAVPLSSPRLCVCPSLGQSFRHPSPLLRPERLGTQGGSGAPKGLVTGHGEGWGWYESRERAGTGPVWTPTPLPPPLLR